MQKLPEGLAAIWVHAGKTKVIPCVDKVSFWCYKSELSAHPDWLTYYDIKSPPNDGEVAIIDVTLNLVAGMTINYTESGLLTVKHLGEALQFNLLQKYGTLDIRVRGTDEEDSMSVNPIFKGSEGYIKAGSTLEIVDFAISELELHSYY
jgi:hypothetical protein